jgi:hypothetical protein
VERLLGPAEANFVPHKSSAMEKWLRELRQAGYEDSTERRFHQPTQRHVTLLPHEKGQRAGVFVKARGANGAERPVNHQDAKG